MFVHLKGMFDQVIVLDSFGFPVNSSGSLFFSHLPPPCPQAAAASKPHSLALDKDEKKEDSPAPGADATCLKYR